MTAAARSLPKPKVTEAQWQQTVIDAAHALGGFLGGNGVKVWRSDFGICG